MAVRTLSLTKSKLTKTGLALLDWGNWSGKPSEFEDAITVPVWGDSHYRHTVFQIAVHLPGNIYDNEFWSIDKNDLKSLERLDVNDWWNHMAEAIMKRVDQEGLLIALPEAINRLTTQSFPQSVVTPKKIFRQPQRE